jgi:amidophosphoribosyltransferase
VNRTVEDAGGLMVAAGHPAAARVVAAGLHAMQHRGRAGAAVVVADGSTVRWSRGEGPVAEAVPPDELSRLAGGVGAGGVRSGSMSVVAHGRSSAGRVGVAVVGALTNGPQLWRELVDDGAVVVDGTDAELILQLLARSTQRTFVNKLVDAVWKVQGAYGLAVMTPDRLVVVRDPAGFRPLWLGRLADAILVASDDQAIEGIGGTLQRPLRPGEMLIVDAKGVQSIAPLPPRPTSACSQELLALAPREGRPFAEPAQALRLRLGAALAERQGEPSAEAVVAAPGPALDVASGFARAAGLQLVPAFVAQHPSPFLEREDLSPGGVLPLRVVPGAVAGQSVVLITGSLTHGHLVRQAASDLAAAGATAVHLRCSAPPVRLACPYGMRVHGADALVASRHPEPDALASWLGVQSVGWLDATSLADVLGTGRCEACLSTDLPLPVAEQSLDDQLALFRDS